MKNVIIYLLFCATLGTNTPAFASIVILNGLSHTHEIKAGEIYSGQIIIQNTEVEEQAVNLYLRDYLFYKSGEIKYDEPGEQARSNTQWVKLSPAYVVLSPREKKIISYEIAVPQLLSDKGTFWSVVMLEGVQKRTEQSTAAQLKINTKVRYAVQLITNVSAEAKKYLRFDGVKLATIKDKPYVVVDVENTGDYLLSPHISLEIFDQTGQSMGVFKSDKRKTFPSTSLRFKLPLENIPRGNYKALLLADCGDRNVFGMNLDLVL
ncbi:MAG: hypothetical protein AAGJ18_21800 [Bacteroidota bacterium]